MRVSIVFIGALVGDGLLLGRWGPRVVGVAATRLTQFGGASPSSNIHSARVHRVSFAIPARSKGAREPAGMPTMLQAVSAVIVLFGFWLLLSGHYTVFLTTAGAASAVAVVLFARRMDVIDREGHPIHLGWGAVSSYWPWLAKEIAKSAWDVTRRILDPRLPISPTLARFRPTQATEMGRVIHANSITLTPGTITIEARPGEFLVHALTREGAAGLAGSEMDRRVTAFEGTP